MRRLVAPMSDAVNDFLDQAKSRTIGRPSTVARLLSQLPAELVAYLAVKETVNVTTGGKPLFRTARHLGNVLEDEVRMATFDQLTPTLYRTVERDVRRKSWDPTHAELIYATAAKAANIELPRWTTSEKVHVGTKLLDLLAESTGLIREENKPVRRNRTVNYIFLSETGQKWINDHNGKETLLRPALTPTVIPPLPWQGTKGGGYLTHAIRPFRIVKRTRRAHVEALEKTNMTPVYQALNAVQDTPWAINTRILAVMEEAALKGILLPGMPPPDPEPLPERPADIDTNDAAKRAWKEAAKAVYEANAEAEGHRLELAQLLAIGAEYRDEPTLYFPHQLDFRGRFYALPQRLQPQGSDRAKALLHFATGKPVGRAGLRWLAIHGANAFGFDKASLDAREDWAWTHTQDVSLCASDPFTWRWWTQADSPWCFLAWCFEWAAAQGGGSDQGEGFVSRLPIALDGSCNGLQHFSAMLRDPVAGAAVNLVPGDAPQDIYQRVADRTVERLREIVDQAAACKVEDEKARWSHTWQMFGITRDITKRPVMVLPYGGTMSSCLDYTRAAVRKQIKGGKTHNFALDLPRAEAFLASVIWAAIGDVVVAARQAMAWLQKVARVATQAGIPLQWAAPSGFIAHQEYRDTRHRRIKSRLRGSLVYISHHEETDDLDKAKQALGISPNFVHSLDAAAMVLTLTRCLKDEITSFAMIHDSYATHAADTDTLAQHLRSAFTDMYEQHDVLQDFYEAVAKALPSDEDRQRLPPPPTRGNLDLKQVLDSAYFFA